MAATTSIQTPASSARSMFMRPRPYVGDTHGLGMVSINFVVVQGDIQQAVDRPSPAPKS